MIYARCVGCLVAVTATLFVALLSGCAASSGDIQAQFVSPAKYQELSCKDIGAEGERVARQVAEISGVEYIATPASAWLTTQTVIVQWPTPWLPTSEGEGAAELSKLKGEFEALERAAALKRCSLTFKQQAT
jgi:hypothetical protein